MTSFALPADKPRIHWRRDHVLYALLCAFLVAVHFMITGAGLARSPQQEAVFDWPFLIPLMLAGLAGVALTNLNRMPGLWDPETPLRDRLWAPLLFGAVFGALALALDFAPFMASYMEARIAQLGGGSPHIVFPWSVPIYFGGGILVTLLYFGVLIPLVVWAISTWALKGRRREWVFWLIAVPCMFIEPFTQGQIMNVADHGALAALRLIPALALSFGQVWFLRTGGLIASILVRNSYYVFSHLIAGVLMT